MVIPASERLSKSQRITKDISYRLFEFIKVHALDNIAVIFAEAWSFSSPKLIVAYYVLRRLLAPRPCEELPFLTPQFVSLVLHRSVCQASEHPFIGRVVYSYREPGDREEELPVHLLPIVSVLMEGRPLHRPARQPWQRGQPLVKERAF